MNRFEANQDWERYARDLEDAWHKEYQRQTAGYQQLQFELTKLFGLIQEHYRNQSDFITETAVNRVSRQKLPHPILLEARQIAPNQILITYDQRTDLASATNIANYWIRSNIEHPITSGISTEGMDYALIESNAIRPDAGIITPVDNAKMRFVMTFRANAISGLVHVVLPCFVNLEGRTGFDDANWGPFSKNMFIGM